MKYSIRGRVAMSDGSEVVTLINDYELWRLRTSTDDGFYFEIWLNSEAEKTNLFNALKPFVDTYTGFIDWHICTHDEEQPQPCVISEEYRG